MYSFVVRWSQHDRSLRRLRARYEHLRSAQHTGVNSTHRAWASTLSSFGLVCGNRFRSRLHCFAMLCNAAASQPRDTVAESTCRSNAVIRFVNPCRLKARLLPTPTRLSEPVRAETLYVSRRTPLEQ